MDWGSGFFPEFAGKTTAFNQLLDRVRSAHEEVCARNAFLESLTVQNGTPGLHHSKKDDPWLHPEGPDESRKDDLWVQFMAPEDGPPPCRPPDDTSNPMALNLQASPIWAKQQEDTSRSIERLVKQQEHLCEQIAKIFTLNTSPECLRPKNSGRHGSRRQSAERHSVSSVRHSARRIGKSVALCESVDIQSAIQSTQSIQSIQSEGPQIQQLRTFAVRTGGTQDMEQANRKKSFYRLSVLRAAMAGDSFTRVREFLKRVMRSQTFTFCIGFLIVSYTALIAVETNMLANDPDMDSVVIQLLHYAYTTIFCVELLARFVADGMATWYGVDAFWNRLDAFLILSGFAEIVVENVTTVQVPGVRTARLLRTVRLVRTWRNSHDFQKMVYALISSVRTLVCSLSLLIFVMFFFAVWLTQSAADVQLRKEIPNLQLRYGDLTSTVYTLFLSVSNGISWDLCYMPLHTLSWWSASGFMLYIGIVLFGLLNVITSVFVESIIRSVQHYKDIIVEDREQEKRIAIRHVKEVFRQVDSDGSGEVSIDEMEYFLREPALRKYMDALDIEADDTRLLFHLLDNDGSGVISVDEFCEGCMRLKGQAKSIDIHALIFRIGNFLDKWGDFTDFVQDSFDQIRHKLPRDSNSRSTSASTSRSMAAAPSTQVGHQSSKQHQPTTPIKVTQQVSYNQ